MRFNSRGSIDTGYIKYITDNEFLRIIEYFEGLQSEPLKHLSLVLAYSGLRVGDVVRLKTDNFDCQFRKINLMMQKTGKHLEICLPKFLSERLLSYYNRYRDRMVDNYLFFASWRNQSQSPHIKRISVEMMFSKLRKKLNLNDVYYTTRNNLQLHRVSPHTLRHYCAYRINQVSNITTAQRWLGHSDIKMTSKYIDSVAMANNMESIVEKAYSF